MGDNTWGELAKNGVISIEPGSAEKCASACVELIDYLLAVKKYVPDVTEIPDLSKYAEGADLAKKLAAKGGDAEYVLDKHIQVLTDMTNAFKDGGAAYADGDGESQRRLADVTIPTEPSHKLGDRPKTLSEETLLQVGADAGDGSKSGEEEIKDDSYDEITAEVYGGSEESVGRTRKMFMKNFTNNHYAEDTDKIGDWESNWEGRFEGAAPVDVWDAYSLDGDELKAFGESLRPVDAMTVSDTWGWFADELNKAKKPFFDSVDAGMSGWTGDGEDAARKAVKKYVKDLQGLRLGMEAMRDNAGQLAFSLAYTKSDLSTLTGDPDTDGDLSWQRDTVNMYYWGDPHKDDGGYFGVLGTDARVPILEDPETSIGGVDGTPSDLPGGSGFPSLGSGLESPGAGGTGPGADSEYPGGGDPSSGSGPGMDGLGQLGRAASLANDAIGDAPKQASGKDAAAQGLDVKPASAAGGSGAAAKSGGGAGAGARPGSVGGADAARMSSLFPRATLPVTAGMTASAMQPVAGTGQSGSPGSAGPAGQGARQGGENTHKRPKYLDSKDHLAESVGQQVVSKPVLDE